MNQARIVQWRVRERSTATGGLRSHGEAGLTDVIAIGKLDVSRVGGTKQMVGIGAALYRESSSNEERRTEVPSGQDIKKMRSTIAPKESQRDERLMEPCTCGEWNCSSQKEEK